MSISTHLFWDLEQMRSLPLESKIIMSSRRIERWYTYFDGKVYVSFSGGKKSIVLKHLVDNIFDDVPSLFVRKYLEYPNIIKEIFSGKYACFNSELYIYPSSYIYQKNTSRMPYIAKNIIHGTMLEKRWIKNGCNEFNVKRGRSIPLSFWGEEDFEEYLSNRIGLNI